MSRAKRHHQTPQVYLKQFADPNGRVHVYDRITQKTLPRQHIKDVAVVSNLYSFDNPAGKPDDSFEQGPLARIDGVIAKILPKMLEPMPSLTIRERTAVCLFIALQFTRTQAFRDQIADSHDLILRMDVEMNVGNAAPERVEQFIRRRYPDASDKLKVEIRRIAADPSQPARLPTIELLGWLAANLGNIADPVIRRFWTFVDPHSGAFLSCDNPVVLFGPQPLGLENAPFIYWPLSPTRLLLLWPLDDGDRFRFEVASASSDLIAIYYQTTSDQATRPVYWHPDTDPLEGVVLPTGELVGTVNGIPVGRSEYSYDKVRQDWLEIRDRMRAQKNLEVHQP